MIRSLRRRPVARGGLVTGAVVVVDAVDAVDDGVDDAAVDAVDAEEMCSGVADSTRLTP